MATTRNTLRAIDGQNARTYADSAIKWVAHMDRVTEPTVVDVAQLHFALTNVRVCMGLLVKAFAAAAGDNSQ